MRPGLPSPGTHKPHFIVNAIRVTGDGALAKELAQRPEVKTIVPDGADEIPKPGVKPPTPAKAMWSINLIGADHVWAGYGTGVGAVIGSIDTGVDFQHEALVSQYRGNLGGGSFDHNYNWWDLSLVRGPPGSPPGDNNGHGTHAMGTMVGGDGDGDPNNAYGDGRLDAFTAVSSAQTAAALKGWIDGGGALAFTGAFVGYSPKDPLIAALGAVWIEDDLDPPTPVRWWNPAHPAFTTPATAPEHSLLTPRRYKVAGQRVEALPGFEVLAGYSPTPTAGQAALILSADERTLFKSFIDGANDADLDGDGVADPVELWTNLVTGMLNGFLHDVPWISESPVDGTLAPGASQTGNVTVDATGLQAGTYTMTLVLKSDSGRAPSITIPVKAIVPAYYKAINAGGGAFTDSAGDVWSADKPWVAGGAGHVNAKSTTALVRGDIKGTVDDPLYAAHRLAGFAPAPETDCAMMPPCVASHAS